MSFSHTKILGAILVVLVIASPPVQAQVSTEKAALLKSELTPFGAEINANEDGSIPAWDGGLVSAVNYLPSGKREDIFANEKMLYSISLKNMVNYADHLTDGVKAMLQKYPNSYRLDVYPTHRTAAAPQWVYDNTFRNATEASLVEDEAGLRPHNAFGGIPFPIPNSAEEVMWNHTLRWRAPSTYWSFNGYQVASNGKIILTNASDNDTQMPYYFDDGSADSFDGTYWTVRSINTGPPLRAGEAITGRENVNTKKTKVWVYLTGQRRVRKTPNACCDTPTPFSAGFSSFDEVEVFNGGLGRFNWELIGKKEMYIPYNSNKLHIPDRDKDVLGENHLNPDHLRWELHRVWIVQATLKDGARHSSPKSIYYIDEDSWMAVLSDRWDANGGLARTNFSVPLTLPDVPAVAGMTWGNYDLIAGTQFISVLPNEYDGDQYEVVPRYDDETFTPDAMAGEGIR